MDAPDAYAHKVMVNTSLRWRGRRWSGEVASAQLPDTVTSIDGYRQVIAQSPPAGSRATPRAELQLEIATATSTSTAAPADPGAGLAGSPVPMPPCQTASGSPAAEGGNLTVPNLSGMTSVQAIEIAEAAGFSGSVEVTEPPQGQHVQPGTVFAQTPAAGSTARGRARIVVYVVPVTR
jgi:hypothetical protein